jgi:hypothetical protein
MTYSSYATEMENGWNKNVIGKKAYAHGLTRETKILYCVAKINKAPYTITDRTSGLVIPCETIEEARSEFGRIQKKLYAKGWKTSDKICKIY